MKKLVALFLSLVLLMTSFSFAIAEEPYKVTIISTFYTEDEPIADEQNSITSAVEKALNVDFDFTWVVSGDAATKFNTVMASTDQPMVYTIASGVTSNANYIDMCQSGVFWDLTDYIQKNDLFREDLSTPAALAATSLDGRNYLFPLITSGARLGILYREDWMEALNAKGYNLQPPTNIENFKAMVEAFATGDPDGNGIDDTIGFAYCDDDNEELDYAGFNLIMAMMGGPVGWGETEDGKLMPYFFFDEYFETLDLFKWMYTNGYMNTDFAINTNKHAPLANNVSGSMCTSAAGAVSNDYDNLDNIVGKDKWNIVAQQEVYTMDGTRVTSSTISRGSLGGILIPKYAVKTEAELEKLLQLITDMFTAHGEVDKLISMGIEGIHYTMEDGVYTQTEEQAKLAVDEKNAVWGSTWPRRIMGVNYGTPETLGTQITRKSIENEAYAVVDKSMGYMNTDMQNLDIQIQTIISDARVQYMMDKIDKDGFIAARDQWLAEGGQEIIDSVNAAYAAK